MGNLVQISPGMTVAAPHADRFRGLLNDLNAAGYAVNPQQSGGYNYRTIDGTSTLSQHAFGRAVDVNWDRNARGTRGDIPPDLARSLAAKHGLTWGGDWKNPDPMHFEVAGGGGASVPVGQRSFMNYAGMQKSAPEQPNEDQQRMSLGGPMPAPYQYQQPQQGGLLDSLASRIQSPLAQQGIGLFLSAAQGNDMNQGMNAGAQRANASTQNLIQQMEMDRVRQQQQLMQGAENNPSFSGLPVEVRAAMTVMDPQSKMSFLSDYMKRRADINMMGGLERQKAEIELQKSLALLKGQREYNMQSLRDLEKTFGGNDAPPNGVPSNARRAPDGNFYVPDPNRPGKYMMWKE